MAVKVVLSSEAALQLEKISAYIAEYSPHNALRWVKKIRTAINSLGNYPEVHAIIYTKEQAGREVRQTFYGVYRILYEIRTDAVYILTVRHGARRPLGPKEVAGID